MQVCDFRRKPKIDCGLFQMRAIRPESCVPQVRVTPTEHFAETLNFMFCVPAERSSVKAQEPPALSVSAWFMSGCASHCTTLFRRMRITENSFSSVVRYSMKK